MNSLKERCQWCPKLYSSAGAYTNHVANAHPGESISHKHYLSDIDTDTDEQSSRARKRRLSDVEIDTSEQKWGDLDLDLNTLPDILISAFNQDLELELESEGSDREVREFSDSDSECDEEESQSTARAMQSQAGTPLREHPFCERDPTYNLYTPFQNSIDYKLAR